MKAMYTSLYSFQSLSTESPESLDIKMASLRNHSFTSVMSLFLNNNHKPAGEGVSTFVLSSPQAPFTDDDPPKVVESWNHKELMVPVHGSYSVQQNPKGPNVIFALFQIEIPQMIKIDVLLFNM